jgi:glycosyltransferase involved in cell wall biosynthesis
MAGSGFEISAVLPCFEEVGVLAEVVETLAAVLAREATAWEIVLVVSAAATDGTPDLARRLADARSNIRVVTQAGGDPGYGRAVALGVAAARYPWVLLSDADGQLDHRELPRLLARAVEADLVVGFRAPRRDPWPRRAAGAFYTRVVCALLGIEGVRDVDCAFKLVWRAHLGAAPLQSRTGAVNAEVLVRARAAGARLAELPVTHRPRRAGRTRFEMRLGFWSHLPHPLEVWAIGRDVAALVAAEARRGASAR